jgi:hypothetical protein
VGQRMPHIWKKCDQLRRIERAAFLHPAGSNQRSLLQADLNGRAGFPSGQLNDDALDSPLAVFGQSAGRRNGAIGWIGIFALAMHSSNCQMTGGNGQNLAGSRLDSTAEHTLSNCRLARGEVIDGGADGQSDSTVRPGPALAWEHSLGSVEHEIRVGRRFAGICGLISGPDRHRAVQRFRGG